MASRDRRGVSTVDLIAGEDALVEAGFVHPYGELLSVLPALAELVDVGDDDAEDLLTVALLGRRPPIDAGDREAIELAVKDLVEDPTRRQALLLALGRRWDDQHRRDVGAIGKELVVDYARDELAAHGHPDLATKVRRVSLQSDQLGYDVVAPRVGGPPRLLEVKATASATAEPLLFLSRAEADVGARFEDWALGICRVDEVPSRSGEIVGWCQRSALHHLLPSDVPGGTWASAAIEISRIELTPGLPRPSL